MHELGVGKVFGWHSLLSTPHPAFCIDSKFHGFDATEWCVLAWGGGGGG